MKPTIYITALLLLCSNSIHAQFLKKLGEKAVKTAERAIERKVEEKTDKAVNKAADKATDPDTYKKGNTSKKVDERSTANTSKANSKSFNISYDAPQAITKVSQPPTVLWLKLGNGTKFGPVEDSKITQVIAVNPYLSPDRPMFGQMNGLRCAPDGSLVLAGTAGLDTEGGVKGVGWWKIAPDGAITSFISQPYGNKFAGIYPSDNFSIAPDGTILTVFSEEINTNRVGTKVVRILSDGSIVTVAKGLENPGMPVQDPSGNIWVANKKNEELLRIAPDGQISTIISAEQSWNNQSLAPKDRVIFEHIEWDAKHGELVVGGGRITAKPHELHTSIWRIRPDGHARRVFYTVKGGRSPVGQNTDALWSLTVDAAGRIVVSTIIMDDHARRQIARLDENTGKLVVLTGQSFADFGSPYYRAGHEGAPHDGNAAHANFHEANNICYGPDGTLFILDEHQVRRLDKDGVVRTWVY